MKGFKFLLSGSQWVKGKRHRFIYLYLDLTDKNVNAGFSANYFYLFSYS